MASSLPARCPSCFGRLGRRPTALSPASLSARLPVPAASPLRLLLPATLPAVTRGKKTGIRGDRGVVVRLLEDVPQFGRRDTILRTDRGRMRNLWYPQGLAEYMTTARLAALGLTAETAVVDRDPFFGVGAPEMAEPEDVAAPAAARPAVQQIDPERAAEILARLPPVLVFHRKPIAPDAPALFGSVSADDVVAALRDALRADADADADADASEASSDAALVRVDAKDVRFVGADSADRIKTLGSWDVEIAVRGSSEVVRKVVEVLPEA